MTVREAIRVLKTAKQITIGYGANAITVNKNDMLVMEAYGDFVVEEISGENDCYDIDVLMKPVREVCT